MNSYLGKFNFFKSSNIFKSTIFHVIKINAKIQVILSIERQSGEIINISPSKKYFQQLEDAIIFVFHLFWTSKSNFFTSSLFLKKQYHVTSFVRSLPKADIYSFSYEMLEKLTTSYKKAIANKDILKWVPSISALVETDTEVSLTIKLQSYSFRKAVIFN